MMVKSHDLNFVPGSNLSRLASAFISVSWTRSSASGGLRQRVRANARRAGISLTRSARAGSRLNCDSDTVADLFSLAGMTGTNACPADLVPPRCSLASATPSGADNPTRSTPDHSSTRNKMRAGPFSRDNEQRSMDGSIMTAEKKPRPDDGPPKPEATRSPRERNEQTKLEEQLEEGHEEPIPTSNPETKT